MAIYLSNDVSVLIDSVDLSDFVQSATINRQFEELNVNAMGDTSLKFAKGLESSTVTLDFLNDSAASASLVSLNSKFGTTVSLVMKQLSSATSATNPSYTTTILINNLTPINGATGDMSTQSITFTCQSVIVVANS